MKNLNKMKIAGDLQFEIGQDKISHFADLSVKDDVTLHKKLNDMKHSTFDKSKFTVVGSPTITDDGIASGFSTSNKITIPFIYDSAKNNRIKFRWIFQDTGNYQNILSFGGNYLTYSPSFKSISVIMLTESSTKHDAGITYLPSVLQNGDVVEVDFIWNNTIQVLKLKVNETEYIGTTSYTDLRIVDNVSTPITLGIYGSWGAVTVGEFDLKHFSITVDGKEVFSGNKTGGDTVKINGTNVEIPYTLSKTGSKIVDAVYRDRVIDLYEQEGYTHYYTIGENDFTLATCKGSDVIAQGEADGIAYTKTADLTLTQRGNCTSGSVVNLLPYKDENSYHISVPYTAKTSNSFTPSADGDFIAVGKCYL